MCNQKGSVSGKIPDSIFAGHFAGLLQSRMSFSYSSDVSVIMQSGVKCQCRTHRAVAQISVSPSCRNTLTSGKDFMKSFRRACQELPGKANTQHKKSCCMSGFLPSVSLLGYLTWKEVRGIALLVWDFQKCSSPDLGARSAFTHRALPALPRSQQCNDF